VVTDRGPRRRPGWGSFLVLAAALLGLAAGSSRFESLRQPFQRRWAAAREFGAAKQVRGALLRMGVLHGRPADSSAAASGKQAYGLDPLSPSEFAEQLRVSPEWLERGVPVVSLLMDAEPLESLRRNPRARGRAWERPAFLGIVEGAKLHLASGVGVRAHGGSSRVREGLTSYRIYLRKRYGATQLPPGVVGPHAPRRLVVRPDLGHDRHGVPGYFGSRLAFDIMRRAGVLAPESASAAFFLNGEFQGIHALFEYLDEEFLETRFGHRQFVLAQTKPNAGVDGDLLESGDRRRYADLIAWTKGAGVGRLEEVEKTVDLDNLMRWFAAVSFCGTEDPAQGDLVLDTSRPDGRWFWIAWDMDVSFLEDRAMRVPAWEKNLFVKTVFRRGAWPWWEPRWLILRPLIERSPAFRERLARTFLDLMNHRWDEEFLNERLAFYESQAIRFGIEDRRFLENLKEYLARRPAALRQQLAEALRVPAAARVEIRSRSGGGLEIDGVAKRGFYQGWYLPESLLALSGGSTAGERWRVDGVEVAAGTALRAPLSGQTMRIEIP